VRGTEEAASQACGEEWHRRELQPNRALIRGSETLHAKRHWSLKHNGLSVRTHVMSLSGGAASFFYLSSSMHRP
jgi:hypothetical protein